MITGETYQPCNPKCEMGVSLLTEEVLANYGYWNYYH